MGSRRDPIRIMTMFRRLCAGLLVAFLASTASAHQDAMTFRLVAAKNCRGPCHIEIAADGIISSESAAAFRAVATTVLPEPIVVRINSPGGNLVGSLQLGDAFREFKATVFVGKAARCISACVYAFLGGTTRRATETQIGVHRFRPVDDRTDGNDFPNVLVQRAADILTEYVTRMGADPGLVRLAMTIQPPAVHFLDADELRRYRVTH
jgi:hypothetical protein